ncbi:hypothetical protein CUR178_02023 [Leishmania enriettii]|uniref:DNA repair protein RAD51 homolog 3 n=1 Tax=Leishmania enriettii TaxID=5663 RepID=A0A836KDJ4_LEIEN|nr:hypothetical protein CUR178_02023 [Leishmania enriettii]
MALIECSELLSSSTKAKLQDAGILYVSDAVALFPPEGCRVRGDRDGHPFSALQHVSTTWPDQMSERDCIPPRRRTSEAAGGNRGSIDGPGDPVDVSRSTETATRSSLRTATDVPSILNLNEDEVDELLEMVARAAAVAHGKCEKRSDTALSAQRSGSSQDPLSSSPPNPPASPPRSAELAHNTCKHAEACESRSGAIPGCRTLREMHAEAQARQAQGVPTHVTTFSSELDGILGGGVPVGGVTEISGPPGVGKTQLLMQLAVSCAMPVEFGGMDGACLFVDTEGSFAVERLEQMATAAVSLVRAILLRQPPPPRRELAVLPSPAAGPVANSGRKRGRSPPLDVHAASPCRGGAADMGGVPGIQGDFSVESVLQRVHYVRVTDLAGLLALLHSLAPWLEEESQGDADVAVSRDTAGTSTLSSTRANRSATGVRTAVRMVLVDSVALPFRCFDGFCRGGPGTSGCGDGDGAVHLHGYADTTVAHNGLAMASWRGPLSKHGLWRRSRLLFQCSTLLEQLASAYQLAVVVTNHMTTKTLRGPATHGAGNESAAKRFGCAPTDGEANASRERLSVLVPALGDAWGQGLSTRLLLSFHHYDLPACSFVDRSAAPTAATKCTEDVVYSLTAASHQQQASPRSVVQHRVVRVLKCSGQPRRETCFLVTSKGVRDARKEIVSQRVDESVGTRDADQPHH